MYIPANSLDDLLMQVYKRLLKGRTRINPTKGAAVEMSGVLLKIANPRARLSRAETRSTLFTCLGEFMWYLAGSNRLDFIKYYIPMYSEFSDNGRTIHGGYGPRLFGTEERAQVSTVIQILKRKFESRQAVIQLFDAADLLEAHKDIPCTCTIQFLLRRGKLDMIVSMRSNDAFKGLPHDVFSFTMLQEIVARSVGAELGWYKHVVGSLHLYDENRTEAERYVGEGWQETVAMDSMPKGDPSLALSSLRHLEKKIRSGQDLDVRELELDPYWADIIRILQIFKFTKEDGMLNRVPILKRQMVSKVYAPYITKRHRSRLEKSAPAQRDLFPDGE
ncbi:thymidylate synthase [Janthinobacterium lividum]